MVQNEQTVYPKKIAPFERALFIEIDRNEEPAVAYSITLLESAKLEIGERASPVPQEDRMQANEQMGYFLLVGSLVLGLVACSEGESKMTRLEQQTFPLPLNDPPAGESVPPWFPTL